jgi:hypothetical protein
MLVTLHKKKWIEYDRLGRRAGAANRSAVVETPIALEVS